MEPPEKGPAANMLAPTTNPMAKGATFDMSPDFGSIAVAYTVYTKPNVMMISNTTPAKLVTPVPNAWTGVSYANTHMT